MTLVMAPQPAFLRAALPPVAVSSALSLAASPLAPVLPAAFPLVASPPAAPLLVSFPLARHVSDAL
jgi:hypothetical protein